jgi:hypothetical protein
MSKNFISGQIQYLAALLYLPPVAGEDLLIEDCSIGAEEGHRIQGLRTAHITIACKTHEITLDMK